MHVIGACIAFVLSFGLLGCVASGERESYAIENAEGGALLVEATRAAQRVLSERNTATIQAATMIAENTRQVAARYSTGTAEALDVREREMILNATANAALFQQSGTRQAATETSELRRNNATATAVSFQIASSETAIVRAQNQSVTATAAVAQASATRVAAISTRDALRILAAMERNQATATAEALELRRTEAQVDAARARTWSEFVDSLLKVILGVGAIAFLVMLIIQIARYLDALALRQKLIETRAGTVLIVATRGGYSAELIRQSPNVLDMDTDEFGRTQLSTVSSQAQDLVKVTTMHGETFLTRSDPDDEKREHDRKLALRLLRESMRHYSALGKDGAAAVRIPGHRQLDWSGDTWNRAVTVIRPYIVTREGRGGGTFCGPEYPSLMQLYSAVGERRIAIHAVPVPTLS